jgi:predicted transcriptional regulator YdeE
MSLIILKLPAYVGVLAALVPSIAFLLLLLYFTIILPKRTPKPKIVTIKEDIYVVGISTTTSKATFLEDDTILWKEYKRVKDKHLIDHKKEEHSFVAVRKQSEGDKNFEYLIGDIVESFDNLAVGLKTLVIPPTTYACFPIHITDEHSWAPAIAKIEKYVYEKWLPKSEYILDTNAVAREIEYHDKRTAETTHTMKFYVAVKHK